MIKLRDINTLLIGFVVLWLMSPLAAAEVEQSSPIEFLELVAVGSVAIATVLSYMAALRLGGEIGTALKVIAAAVTCIGILREIFAIIDDSEISEIFEILGGIGLLIGFFLLYKSIK